MPVFNKYKFCADVSTFELSKGEVSEDLKSCLDFLNEHVKVDYAEFHFIS